MSPQGVSADIIPNSAVWIFSPKLKEQRHKQLGLIDIEMNIFTPKGFEGCQTETSPT